MKSCYLSPMSRGHSRSTRLSVFIGLILLVAACNSQSPQVETSVRTQSMQEMYAETLQLAREWKTDAYLVSAETVFTNGSDTSQLYYDFLFGSHSSPSLQIMLAYDSRTGAVQDKILSISQDSIKQNLEILDTDWPVDSVEALQVAQDHGGSQFLGKHSDGWLSLLLRLEKRFNEGQARAVWFVSYYDQTANEVLRVVVDASTGEVVDIDSGQ